MLYDEVLPAEQCAAGSNHLDRTTGRTRRNGRGEVRVGEHLEAGGEAVEGDAGRALQVRAEQRHGAALLAGE